MAITWAPLVNRAHVSTRLVGEVLLAALLAVAVVSMGRDSAPDKPFNYSIGPVLTRIEPLDVSANKLRAGKPSQLDGSSQAALAIANQLLVPTARPVQLLIPSLDVHRAVESVGANRNGVMNLPANSWNAGWYGPGPVPGAPGDAVIEGHAGYPGQPMIFGRLVNLRPGANIVVVLADGSRQLFLVESIGSIPVGTSPPGMAEPYGPPRLTLITCTGHFDKNTYSYSSRLVVEASYAGRV